MTRIQDIQLFNRIRKTMSLFSMSGEGEKVFSSDSLALINTPALLGKRDALFEKAMNILGGDFSSIGADERSKKYEEALFYLVAGIETGRQIFFGDGFKEKKRHENNPLGHYMLLLADTVQAALTLCNHQIIFQIEKDKISDFIGRSAAAQIQSEDAVFSEAERAAFECAKKLIQKAESAIHNYQELLKKSMSKEDEGRYKKAFMEFLGSSDTTQPE